MDAPRPNSSTPASLQILTYEWRLECGCTLTHAVHNRTGVEDCCDGSIAPETAAWFAQNGHGQLAYWFRARAPRHRCELVSADNPNGIAPRNPQQATS